MTPSSTRPSSGDRITRDDIVGKLRDIQGDVVAVEQDARSMVATAVAVGIGVVVVAAFLLGRRRGRRRSTFVEIRRV